MSPVAAMLVATVASSGVRREDFRVPGEPGIELFVREVRRDAPPGGEPILLLHGARVPGLASFDLPVAGGSLAQTLAEAGHRVYVMDARGSGRSTRPPEMSQPPEGRAPLVRSSEVVRDVVAVVEWIRGRTATPRVALLGWATGGQRLGHYASLYSDRVSHLLLLNALYGATAQHSMIGPGSDLEDPERPGRFRFAAVGAYSWSDAESLRRRWDRSAEGEDAEWRDAAVVAAYVREALASDTASASRTPAAMRAPTGALEDSFYLASGRRLWDASLIRCPTLAIRAERDFWSRPEDVTAPAAELVHAPEVRTLTLPGATHFVHLDRSERGRAALVSAVLAFLAGRPAP
jgi:pimeloyl-ACP methyl ester carboxylesterase